MKHNYLVISIFLIFCCFNSSLAQVYTWKQKADYGGGAVYDPFSFVVNGKAYVGTGVSVPLQYLQSFWEYDPALNIWTQKADFMGTARYGARGFAIGDFGYAGTGWDSVGNDNNFYRYEPATNLWTQVASFAGSERYTASAFVVGNEGYIGLGYATCKNDFWKYNPISDSWSQVANFPGAARQAAESFVINDVAYVGNGACPGTIYTDFYKYEHLTNTWTAAASFPGPPRNAAFSFAIGTDGYVVMGFDYVGSLPYTIRNDVWKYNSLTDTWLQMPDFPGKPRFEGFAFTIGDIAYIGVGNDTTTFNTHYINDFWEFSPDSSNVISGLVFVDSNNNGVQDSGEVLLPYVKIVEQNTNEFVFTNSIGEYVMLVGDSGNYEVAPELLNNHFAPTPATHTAYFSNTILQVDSLNDFAYQAVGVVNDLCVNINPTGPFRSNGPALYYIHYNNQGNTTISPTVVFYPDTNVTYTSASITPDAITPDSVVFNLPPLAPYQSGTFWVQVQIDFGLVIGTLINSYVMIYPVAGDVNPTCNQSAWEMFVTGSYDPNDILVNRATMFDFEVPTTPWLEYLIRFQNTGNDTAFYVRLDNPIAAELQIGTFEMITASHPCEISYNPTTALMSFTFNPILLADSNVNEPASHGFVRYRIKAQPNLILGDSIVNNAGIYFDFNPPVITNDAVTKVISPVGINDNDSHNSFMQAYPTPATNQLNLAFISPKAGSMEITFYNLYGQKVLNLHEPSVKYGKNNFTLNVSNLSSGVYLIKTSGVVEESLRMVKF